MNNNYWQNRFFELEKALHNSSQNIFHEVETAFNDAYNEINNEINIWYNRIAKNNQLSMLEARKLLNKNELDAFKWSVEEYINFGQANAISGQWIKELENASAKYHINRLEALKIKTGHSFEIAYNNELKKVDKLAKDVFTDGYYHSLYEIQKGFNTNFNVGQIDDRKLEKIISKPWASDGKNYSDRIWEQKTKMINSLHNELIRNCILGESPDKAIQSMTRYVSNNIKSAKHRASMLVLTEQAFFTSAAQKECFEDLDVEEFEILATLDLDTSDICQAMDGKHFPMSEFQIGITAPPFHPHCRSVVVPYFNDIFTENLKRTARDENGDTYYIDEDIKYEEWYKKYVTKEQSIDIISKSNPLLCKNFDELDNYYLTNYNLNISDEIKNLNFENVREVLEGIDVVIKEFPQTKYKLQNLGIIDEGIMSTNLDGCIKFNPKYFKNYKDCNTIKDSALTGFRPKNTSVLEVGCHEAGHLIDSVLIDQSAHKQIGKNIQWRNFTQAKLLIHQACQMARKELIDDNIDDKYLKIEVSRYAIYNDAECLAECISDYVANRENASMLSRMVWNLLKERLS